MDRFLIIKILGKKNSVDFDDAIYNLKDISEKLRNYIILNLDIEDDIIIKNNTTLKVIHKTILNINYELSNIETLQGYTNSKKFLQKYISNIEKNINGVIESLASKDKKLLTYYCNMLIDLLLVY